MRVRFTQKYECVLSNRNLAKLGRTCRAESKGREGGGGGVWCNESSKPFRENSEPSSHAIQTEMSGSKFSVLWQLRIKELEPIYFHLKGNSKFPYLMHPMFLLNGPQ